MMTTRADFMDSVDLIRNRIIKLIQERDQLRQRVADLEAQLEAAQGWVYVEDGGLPSEREHYELTVRYDDTLCGYDIYVGYHVDGVWFSGDKRIAHGTVAAYRPLPQPAPLRTAARATGIAAGEDGE